MSINHLENLARYVSELSFEDLPCEVLECCRLSCIDSIGAAIGGVAYEENPEILRTFAGLTGAEEKGVSVWGSGSMAPLLEAAFLNGILAHSLELDDVHTASKTHIGAVVLPTAWTVAEEIGASGEELTEAVVAGYETMARIGQGFGVSDHRLRGWHVTGTAGTFGAAAAAGKLLKLDPERMLSAFGIAGTQSSGLWAFLADGATSKKLHPGRAAESGIAAAYLSSAGMTGPSHILDAEDGGLYRATSSSWDMSLVDRALGEEFEITRMDRKPYSCCRSIHPAIDAVLEMKALHGVGPEDVERATVRTYDVGVRQCGAVLYPENVSEAKFSTRYGVAVAFFDGEAVQRQFSDERIADPAVRELAGKVDVLSDVTFTDRYPGQWGCSLTVELRDGSELVQVVYDARGSVANPMTGEHILEKYRTLTKPVLGDVRSDLLLGLLNDLPHVDRISPI